MGLFSSKKKVVVNTTVAPVFRNEDIKNSPLTGTIRAILFDQEIQENVKEELLGSIGVRVNNQYTWAKNNYLYGTPAARVASQLDAQAKVMEQLVTLYGAGVTTDYYLFGPLNSVHYAWKTLLASHGYIPATNVLGNLTTTKGFTVYLVDIVPTYTQATYDFATEQDELGQFDVHGPLANSGITVDYPTGNPSATVTPYVVSPAAPDNFITVYYQYKNASNVVINESFEISMSSVAEDNDWHQVRYVTSGGTIGYFTYEDGAGTYPLIDAVFDLQAASENLGTFLPWIYFRYDFQNIGREDNQTSEEYKDSVKLCKYVGVDYQTMSDAIHEDQDVSDVIQNIMLFGVPSSATYAVEKEYLFRYFDGLFTAQTNGDPEGMIGSTTGSSTFAQIIKDSRFTMTFSFAGIKKEVLAGQVAAVGKYSSAVVGSTGEYCKQISEISYIKVTIYNPTLRNHIQGKYGHVASMGEPELRIPVDRAILRQMSLIKREELLSRAMFLNVNTYVEIKTPWYASSWFKIVLIVVVIVLTIMTMGGFAAAWAAIAALIAAGAVAVAIAILTYIVQAIIVQYAVKLFIDVAGLEGTIFAAVVMIAVAAYNPSMTIGGLAAADAMVAVGNNMITQVAEGYQELTEDVMKEINAFNKYTEGKWDEIEGISQELASQTNFFDSLQFVTLEPGIVFGEEAEAFYQRTIHSGNIGVATYNQVTDFVANSLKLPKFVESPNVQKASNDPLVS